MYPRGSIPLLWEQMVNIRYKPDPNLLPGRSENTQHIVFSRHCDDQMKRYGSVVAVSLIDQKGPENVLGQAFERHCSRLSNPAFRYVPFDFHKECKGLQWHMLSKLLDQLEREQESQAYLLFDVQSGHVIRQQSGVFRANCIDCLDRTNVVQSMLARRSLQHQLSPAAAHSRNEDRTSGRKQQSL